MSIQEILKILTDSGIEPNEANVEVKMLLEHFADYGFKDIIAGKKLTADKIAIVKEKALLRAKTGSRFSILSGLLTLWVKSLLLIRLF